MYGRHLPIHIGICVVWLYDLVDMANCLIKRFPVQTFTYLALHYTQTSSNELSSITDQMACYITEADTSKTNIVWLFVCITKQVICLKGKLELARLSLINIHV